MTRAGSVVRQTKETDINLRIMLDGTGATNIDCGIPFMDHMLTLFAVHGLFDLDLKAVGDLNVDYHHTIEDMGLVLGEAISQGLNDRRSIRRYGHAVIPMDDALAAVSVDLSNRPFLVCHIPDTINFDIPLTPSLAKEFFRAVVNKGGMNLHINVAYGENDHHIIEAIFKAFGRAMDQAVSIDDRVAGIPSSKGSL